MKTSKCLVLLIVAFSSILGNVWARPVDLSIPKGGVGSASLNGYVELWRDIPDVEIQFGKGSSLSLRYMFSTEPGIRGILGFGFYVPMFEAKNVLIREQMMRVFLPCGKGLYLRRNSSNHNKFQTVDQEWTGILDKDEFIVSRNDGWKLAYNKGRLVSLTSDDNHTFTWTYDPKGLPIDLSENGQTLIKVESNTAGQVKAFIFHDKRYEVDFAEREIIQVLSGKASIKEKLPALSNFKYPDGKVETFKFAFSQTLIPILTFTDKDNKETCYNWDPATNLITQEKGPTGDWVYTIGKVTPEFSVPPISRTNADNRSEGLTMNTQKGIYVTQGTDGVTTITYIFETPGPLYHKVQKIEKVQKVDGKEVTTQTFKGSYDEKTGKLTRKVDQQGFTWTYTYGENGKVKSTTVKSPSDPKILEELKAKEKSYLTKLDKLTDVSERDDVMQDLGIFYILRMGDSDKALALTSKMTGSLQIFNIKMQAIVGNKNLERSKQAEQLQKLLEGYPEQKDLLTHLIEIRTKEKNEQKL